MQKSKRFICPREGWFTNLLDRKSRIPIEIKYILVTVMGVAVIWFGIRFAFGSNNPFYVVASESMLPKLKVGDLLIVKHDYVGFTAFNDLKIGDIIVFKTPGVTSDGQHKIIVHRVAQIVNDNDGNRIIRTKGDANPSSIPFLDYPIREKNYIGKVVYIIPHIGLLTRLISPPINYIIIAAIIGTMLFYLRRGMKERVS